MRENYLDRLNPQKSNSQKSNQQNTKKGFLY